MPVIVMGGFSEGVGRGGGSGTPGISKIYPFFLKSQGFWIKIRVGTPSNIDKISLEKLDKHVKLLILGNFQILCAHINCNVCL